MDERTYLIKRMYASEEPSIVLMTGMSLEDAQAHCRDRETSSRTATSPEAVKHTLEHGAWFDGYEEES